MAQPACPALVVFFFQHTSAAIKSTYLHQKNPHPPPRPPSKPKKFTRKGRGTKDDRAARTRGGGRTKQRNVHKTIVAGKGLGEIWGALSVNPESDHEPKQENAKSPETITDSCKESKFRRSPGCRPERTRRRREARVDLTYGDGDEDEDDDEGDLRGTRRRRGDESQG